MSLQDKYENETGKQAYQPGGVPEVGYVEWLERKMNKIHQICVNINYPPEPYSVYIEPDEWADLFDIADQALNKIEALLSEDI